MCRFSEGVVEENIRKILVIKLRAVGDVVLSTAVLPNLRKAFEGAEIHFMVERSGRGVLEGNPHVDRIIVHPRREWGALPKRAAWREGFTFLKKIRKEGYDLVFDLFGNPRSAFLTWMTGASCRVGFAFRGRKYAYNKRVPPRGDRVHEVEFNLDALRALGIPIVVNSPCFSFSKRDGHYADGWIEGNGLRDSFLVGIHPWGSWKAKRWGLEKFAALADRLGEALQAGIVLLWGPGEKKYAEKVQTLARYPTTIAPETSLKELGALLSRCRLVVANDSGPMHISAAVGTPTVGIFGPTNSKLQGPYGESHEVARKEGLACLGCNKLECRSLDCMNLLSTKEVFEVVQNCITKNKLTTSSVVA